MDWMSLFETALKIGAPVLGTLLTGLVLWALKKKLNLQITVEQEKILMDVISKAVNFAEEWAHKQAKDTSDGKKGAVPTGEEKLKQATEFAKKEVARVGIKLTDMQVDALLHSALSMIRPKGP